jgi:hypothetical protein
MLGHTDIQTTMINLHERDCIVTTAERHIDLAAARSDRAPHTALVRDQERTRAGR